jgi:prepilin-type N-terminal cleavage/methylation domain-containing protein
MQKNRKRAGFTLMELSVVLTIIGLLTGGIMLGQSLITSSRLQTAMTDADNYITAVANFKNAYQALPGDMASATSLWGTDSNGCPSGGGASGTCNGDGNGQIGDSGYESESFRMWQHLNSAGMFGQRLSGVAASSGVYSSTTGTNVPSSSITGGGFFMVWKGTVGGSDGNYFSGFYGHTLFLGTDYTNAGTAGALLTPDQAAGIDGKIDDGFPGSGKIRAPIAAAAISPNCTLSASAYNTSVSGRRCPLLFVTGY